jgi:hypothetical protein
MTPIEIKDIKKGDTFFEKGPWNWHTLTALEDGHFRGKLDIMDKTYDQYEVMVLSNSGQKYNILVTEGLNHYNGKFFKGKEPTHSLPWQWVEDNL